MGNVFLNLWLIFQRQETVAVLFFPENPKCDNDIASFYLKAKKYKMTNQLPSAAVPPPLKQGFSGKQVLMLVVGSMLLAIIATAIAIKIILFPSPFKPVELSAKEEQQLSAKLLAFEGLNTVPPSPSEHEIIDGTLKPQRYTEEGTTREIDFSERELNALLAKNTDMADKLAIDLAKDMISLKLLIPLDPDFPIMGGKTLRVTAGAELAYRSGRPVVRLKGVSLMGVPMPNAWLGGIKNIDLVREFGTDPGFWKTFSEGVESVNVVEGYLQIKLKP